MQTLDYGTTRPSPIVPLLKAVMVFGIGMVLGAVIWWQSPRFTGQVEPWDSPTVYYPVALLAAGAFGAVASPRHFWAAPVGVWIGQFIYALLALPGGPLWILGLFVGALYALLALAGSAAIYLAWRAWPRRLNG